MVDRRPQRSSAKQGLQHLGLWSAGGPVQVGGGSKMLDYGF